MSWFKSQVTSRQLHKPPSPRGVIFWLGDLRRCSAGGCFPNKTPKKLIRKTTGRFQSFKPWNSQAKKKKWPARKEVCVFFLRKKRCKNPTDHFQKWHRWHSGSFSSSTKTQYITHAERTYKSPTFTLSYLFYTTPSSNQKKINSQEEAKKKLVAMERSDQSSWLFCWSQSPCLHFALQQIKACGTLLSTVACIVKNRQKTMLNVWRYVV